MVWTCCCVCNCKNGEFKSGKISLYKFPRVNLHFSKEYQQLQKEGCRVWVATFNRSTPNIKITTLRICYEHFTAGISTELRFLFGTYSDSHNDTDTYLLFLIFSFNYDKIKRKKGKMEQHRAIVISKRSENGIVIMSDGK